MRKKENFSPIIVTEVRSIILGGKIPKTRKARKISFPGLSCLVNLLSIQREPDGYPGLSIRHFKTITQLGFG